MRAIIGYGNELRGEDSFGADVIKELQKLSLHDTKLIAMHQLTPEIVLELLEVDEVIFVDTCYDEKNHYALACLLKEQSSLNLSHHISPKTIIYMLNTLYDKKPEFLIYSMMSACFEKIADIKKYNNCIKMVAKQLVFRDTDR